MFLDATPPADPPSADGRGSGRALSPAAAPGCGWLWCWRRWVAVRVAIRRVRAFCELSWI